jgi:hypothetical protein
MILFLPFSPAYATVMLFAMISFWTRIPAVGIPMPYFPVLLAADMVDFFSMIISLNLGGLTGGIVSLYANLMSRLCGVYPSWKFALEDAGSMFIACLMIPFIKSAFGLDIFSCMIVFTLIRAIILVPISFVLKTIPLVQWIVEFITGISAVFIFNGIYARFFGNFFNGILEKGVSFNWILFLFVTAVIVVFYVSVFGTSKTIKLPPIMKIVKHYLHKSKAKEDAKASDQDKEDIRIIKGSINR